MLVVAIKWLDIYFVQRGVGSSLRMLAQHAGVLVVGATSYYHHGTLHI